MQVLHSRTPRKKLKEGASRRVRRDKPFSENDFACWAGNTPTRSTNGKERTAYACRGTFKALFTMKYAFALSAAAHSGQAARLKGYRFDSTCFVENLWSIPMRIIRDDIPGFTPPGDTSRPARRRYAIAIELLTSFALICAIAIAAFAVSMEIAEAGALKSVHASVHGIAVTALLVLLFATGSLTVSATIAPAMQSKFIRTER